MPQPVLIPGYCSVPGHPSATGNAIATCALPGGNANNYTTTGGANPSPEIRFARPQLIDCINCEVFPISIGNLQNTGSLDTRVGD